MRVALAHEAPEERDVEARLRALLARYDTSRYTFTTDVVVEQGAIPHSHPVLTLGTRRYDDDHLLLADYLHEQLHWFLDERDGACRAAIAELRKLYPSVPVGHPDGARDEFSTYLHLVLCPLEHAALVDVAGNSVAVSVRRFWQSDHYRWIYRTVEADWDVLMAVIEDHDLVPPR